MKLHLMITALLFAAGAMVAAVGYAGAPALAGKADSQEELAINPPPIGIDFKVATLQEIADHLARATGQSIEVSESESTHFVLGGSQTFTLAAREKPFWEIIRELSRQHPLEIMACSDSQLALRNNAGTDFSGLVIAGPLAILPKNIFRQREASPQEKPDGQLAPESGLLQCFFAVDPRIQILKFAQPVMTEIKDDLGNDLLKERAAEKFIPLTTGRAYYDDYQFPLKTTEKRGKVIRSAKGYVRFIAQTADDHVDLDGATLKSGATFRLAGNTFILDQFDAVPRGDGWMTVKLSISQQHEASITMLAGSAPEPLPIAITLRADGGFSLITQSIFPHQYGTAHPESASVEGLFSGPFTLHLSAPIKTKEVILPFELKDLTLP